MRSTKTLALVPLSSILRGAVRHTLTQEQTKRIAAVREVFDEHIPQPLEQWLDNFSRDTHPNAEIAIWERMAETYKDQIGSSPSAGFRRRVFERVLQRSLNDNPITVGPCAS
jgi:hypothetical protein